MGNPIQHRYDFSALIEIVNGNPNGDPDAGNMPRQDDETGIGLITDVCIKHKIRNYVHLTRGDDRNDIYVIRRDGSLNSVEREALRANGIDVNGDDDKELKAKGQRAKKDNPRVGDDIRRYICDRYYDVRTFGAVLTTAAKTGLNYGQLMGPVQLSFGRSIDPVSPQETTITRCVATTDKDAEEKNNQTMGSKWIIPYGLYRIDGCVNATLAQKTGFDDADLDLLWEAMLGMFDLDKSASRAQMNLRRLYVAEHSTMRGDAPSWKVFDAIKIQRKDDVDFARSFDDYEISMDDSGLPENVKMTEKVENESL